MDTPGHAKRRALQVQEFLEGLIKPDEKDKDKGAPLLVDYREHHTGSHVHFTLQLPESRMAEALGPGVETRFKLGAKLSTGGLSAVHAQDSSVPLHSRVARHAHALQPIPAVQL